MGRKGAALHARHSGLTQCRGASRRGRRKKGIEKRLSCDFDEGLRVWLCLGCARLDPVNEGSACLASFGYVWDAHDLTR